MSQMNLGPADKTCVITDKIFIALACASSAINPRMTRISWQTKPHRKRDPPSQCPRGRVSLLLHYNNVMRSISTRCKSRASRQSDLIRLQSSLSSGNCLRSPPTGSSCENYVDIIPVLARISGRPIPWRADYVRCHDCLQFDRRFGGPSPAHRERPGCGLCFLS